MAARINKHHQDLVRAKIQASNIITVLQKHIDGKIELSPTQVTSAKILLDKSISNAPTVLAGDQNNPIVTQSIPPPNISIDEWLKRYKDVDSTDG